MTMNKFISIAIVLLGLTFICACEDDRPVIMAELDTTPYELTYGDFPEPNLPTDNPLTKEGVKLGRMLFYETLLSKDDSQACASCHRQTDGFSDTTKLSIGVEGFPGNRQAMSVFNMAWHSNEFFWDGRSITLRDQALRPIQDPLEMNETLENVVAKLSTEETYTNQFIRAFGSDVITANKMGLAMEQFMLSIVSYDSKYDKYLAGEVQLTESEERGRLLFETEYNPFFPDESGADCAHCHGGFNFENDQFMNNGLDSDSEFTDTGRAQVTELPSDIAKFKVPTLRNIALTPPYMHDGRFEDLEAVIDHYNSHIQESSTLDPALLQVVSNGGLKLSEQDKTDLVNFLGTLTDDTFVNNTAYSNPF